ncbi:MAG: DUF1553 domain-containing protein, partial [Planctomycetota bacterium]
VRDCLYAVSDSLNYEMSGPGVRPPLPNELVKTLKNGQWTVTPNVADHSRRSIYLFARRNLRYPLFATFDRPAANCSCAVRHESTTATQSLSLLNSRLTKEACEKLVSTVRSECRGREHRCERLFFRVVGRTPTREEVSELVSFIEEQVALLEHQGDSDPEYAASVDLSLALVNSNAFLYVD